jgi:hypothetical protein
MLVIRMYDFFYHVKFSVNESDFNIYIILSNDNFYIPAYIRSYDSNIINNNRFFEMVYEEFKEYLNKTKVVISRENFSFIADKIKNYKLEIPKLYSITFSKNLNNIENLTNSLTTKELLFLIFVDGKEINCKNLKKWEIENRLNVPYLTQSLLDAGLITKNNFERNLLKANRPELIAVVEKYNLDVVGDNKDLIKKIKMDLTTEQIKENFCGTHYHLTDKGLELVKKFYKLEEFNRSHYHFVDNMRTEEFHLLSEKKPEYNYQAISRLLLTRANKLEDHYLDWELLKSKLDILNDNVEILPNTLVKAMIKPEKSFQNKREDEIRQVKLEIKKDEENIKADPVNNDGLLKRPVEPIIKKETIEKYDVNITPHEKIKETFKTSSLTNSNKTFSINKISETNKKNESIHTPNEMKIIAETDEDYKVLQSIEAYHKRKEVYLQQQRDSDSKSEIPELIKSKKSNFFRNLIKAALIIVMVLIIYYYEYIFDEILKFESVIKYKL